MHVESVGAAFALMKKKHPPGSFRRRMQSAIVCSSKVNTRIPAKTQSKGAALLGEESAASLRRGRKCKATPFSEEHLETPILQYAGGVIAAKLDRTEKKELVHGVIFPYFSRGELGSHWRDQVRQDADCPVRDGVLPGNVRLVSGEILFCGKALPQGKKAAVHAGP